MLRTELPHASRVVRPASARRRIAGSDVVQRHEVELHVLPRGDVPEPARVTLGDVRERVELCRVEDALRDLDAQHLRVGVLPLTVGAAQQPELPPFVRRDLAALEACRASRRTSRCRPCRRMTAVCGPNVRGSSEAAMIISTARRASVVPSAESGCPACSVESMPARPATAPTTMIPGKSPSSPGRISAPSVSSVPCHVLGPGRETPSSTAAGVPRRPPAREQLAAIATRSASPISTTRVALPGSSERRTGPYAASAWPETTTNADARPRCVTGMPASNGAAIALEMPGHDLEGHAGGGSASASSPPRPKTNGSPHLSRTMRGRGARRESSAG